MASESPWLDHVSGGFEIRAAIPSDLEAVSALLERSYGMLLRAAYDADVLSSALPLITRANPVLLASGTYYVCTVGGGGIVGCGGWTLVRPGAGEGSEEAGLGHIRHFATDPDWSRRGVGRTIYLACVAGARSAGVHRLECYSSMNAEGFYKALGLTAVETIEVPLDGGVAFPAVRMQAII